MSASPVHRCPWLDDAMAPCPVHGDDCADVVVVRVGTGMYGIPIRDGSQSFLAIDYCPGCGQRL